MSTLGIIPAAGKGTRFKELGKQYSKSILPVNNKPLIVYQIEYMLKYCDKVKIVLGHNSEKTKEVIQLYFKNNKIDFCYQETLDGLATAINTAISKTDYVFDNVLIVLSDILPNDEICTDFPFISVQQVNDYSRWCMVSEKDGYCHKFFDKPKIKPKTNKAVSGIYFFKDIKFFKECLLKCNKKIRGEYQISTAMIEYNKKYKLKLIDVNITDFGTLEEYLKNRNLKKCRSFNDIEINGEILTKKSVQKNKIISEVSWFKNIPTAIKCYTPRIYEYNFYNDDNAWYSMSYIKGQTLRDIFLFLSNDIETWNEIFLQIKTYLNKTLQYNAKNNFLNSMYDKTVSRIKNIKIPKNDQLIKRFLEKFRNQLNKDFVHDRDCVIHGDLCFSNIISTNNGIVLIDPRGEVFGSQYYDIAKLMHSVNYNYDFIDSELYFLYNNNIKIFNDGKSEIIALFNNFLENFLTPDEIILCKYICASLFISMIPLHYHNEQNQKMYYKIFESICYELEI